MHSRKPWGLSRQPARIVKPAGIGIEVIAMKLNANAARCVRDQSGEKFINRHRTFLVLRGQFDPLSESSRLKPWRPVRFRSCQVFHLLSGGIVVPDHATASERTIKIDVVLSER